MWFTLGQLLVPLVYKIGSMVGVVLWYEFWVFWFLISCLAKAPTRYFGDDDAVSDQKDLGIE